MVVTVGQYTVPLLASIIPFPLCSTVATLGYSVPLFHQYETILLLDFCPVSVKNSVISDVTNFLSSRIFSPDLVEVMCIALCVSNFNRSLIQSQKHCPSISVEERVLTKWTSVGTYSDSLGILQEHCKDEGANSLKFVVVWGAKILALSLNCKIFTVFCPNLISPQNVHTLRRPKFGNQKEVPKFYQRRLSRRLEWSRSFAWAMINKVCNLHAHASALFFWILRSVWLDI